MHKQEIHHKIKSMSRNTVVCICGWGIRIAKNIKLSIGQKENHLIDSFNRHKENE